MRLAKIKHKKMSTIAIRIEDGFIDIAEINKKYNLEIPIDFKKLVDLNNLDKLLHLFNTKIKSNIKEFEVLVFNQVNYEKLYNNPGKIWGIGLNYENHAEDLFESTPQGIPASFMRPNSTIIGYDDEIKISKLSEKTTGEAELGIILGKNCKNIDKDHWLDVVAGYTCIIDVTAEDILRQNPRYLTLSKSFDTYFSFGPEFVTKDEVDDVTKLEVQTVLNNEIIAKNTVSNMTFLPDFLVSYHSQVMTFNPGDIISTGTPKAVTLRHKDVIECRINNGSTNFPILKNQVVDLKIYE